MALTRDFKETIKARVERDPGFRKALLARAAQAMLAGETDIGKTMLRDYINATIGFQGLGADIDKTPESLMRMLSATGNPRTNNLMEIFEYLQQAEGIQLEVKPV
jgi:DNA-binding phage protein